MQPAVQNHRIVGLERVEDGKELGLGGAVVPLPVAAEQLQQFIDGSLGLAGCMQGLGQIETGLVIAGVCIHRGPQLRHRACVFRLAGKLDLREGRFDFRCFSDLRGCSVQHRLGLIQFTQCNMGPRQPAISGGILVILTQDGGKGLSRIRNRTFGQHLFRSFQRFAKPAVSGAARGLDHLLQEGVDFRCGQSALKHVDRAALHKGDYGRDGLQRQPLLRKRLRQALVLIHVDLGHGDSTLGLCDGGLQHRAQGFAGAAPGSPEIHDHRSLHRRVDNVLHEGGFGHVLDQITRRCGAANNIAHQFVLRLELPPIWNPVRRKPREELAVTRPRYDLFGIAQLMRKNETALDRHADPCDVYSRMAVLSLMTLTVWSRLRQPWRRARTARQRSAMPS